MRRGGWVLIDVLTGIMLVAGLMTIVAIALGRQREVMGRLDDSQAAAHDAEAVLVAMESGEKPVLPGDCRWTVTVLRDQGLTRIPDPHPGPPLFEPEPQSRRPRLGVPSSGGGERLGRTHRKYTA